MEGFPLFCRRAVITANIIALVSFAWFLHSQAVFFRKLELKRFRGANENSITSFVLCSLSGDVVFFAPRPPPPAPLPVPKVNVVWDKLPSQHCILAPQGPHAVLLVSAWARVCVLGS